jgi:hypothetical protein
MFEINASIVKHKARIWCAYRTDNLYQYDAKSFISELDEDFNLLTNIKLVIENKNPAFEDVRLFSAGDNLLALFTYLPINDIGGWDWRYGVGLGIVDTNSGVIKSYISLRQYSTRYHEKNWCPYIYNDYIYVVTDWYPHVRILEIGQINKPFDIHEVFFSNQKQLEWAYGEIRGGTPLISCPESDDGWVYGFVHSSLQNHEGYDRYYYFTAVRLHYEKKKVEIYPQPLDHFDNDKIDHNYNSLWNLSNNKRLKVIFPMGIMDHDSGVIVSFGKDDVESVTEYYTWTYLRGLFE